LHRVGRDLGITARDGERPDQPGVVTPENLIEPGARRQRDLRPSAARRTIHVSAPGKVWALPAILPLTGPPRHV
jgi:hypothetical protein